MTSSCLLAFTVAFAVGCAAAGAATPIDLRHAARADVRIDLVNIQGSVTVTAWDKPEVAVAGSLGEGAKPLALDGSDERLRIVVEPAGKPGWFGFGTRSMGDTVLDVKVPKEAELHIDVVSADATVSGVGGRVLNLNSVSGKVRADSGARELEIDSVSGDVDVTARAERSRIETVSGSVRVRGITGTAKLESVSGDLDVETGDYRSVNGSTVSGDFNLRGTPAAGARIAVETMSGDVHLRLPATLSAKLDLSSFSGRIRNDFGGAAQGDDGKNVKATLGSGDGEIRIETFSGDIDLRKP